MVPACPSVTGFTLPSPCPPLPTLCTLPQACQGCSHPVGGSVPRDQKRVHQGASPAPPRDPRHDSLIMYLPGAQEMGLAFPQKSLKCFRTLVNPKVTLCIGPGSHSFLGIPPHFPDGDHADQKAVTTSTPWRTNLSRTCINTTNGLTHCKAIQVLLNGKYNPKVCTKQLPSPTSFCLTLPSLWPRPRSHGAWVPSSFAGHWASSPGASGLPVWHFFPVQCGGTPLSHLLQFPQLQEAAKDAGVPQHQSRAHTHVSTKSLH